MVQNFRTLRKVVRLVKATKIPIETPIETRLLYGKLYLLQKFDNSHVTSAENRFILRDAFRERIRDLLVGWTVNKLYKIFLD